MQDRSELDTHQLQIVCFFVIKIFLVDYGVKIFESSLLHIEIISIYEIDNIENMLPSLSTKV